MREEIGSEQVLVLLTGIVLRETYLANSLSWELKMNIKEKGYYLYHPGRL